MTPQLTPEMMKVVFFVMAILALNNIGLIAGWVRSHFKRLSKMEKDLDAAHAAIRELKKQIFKLEEK